MTCLDLIFGSSGEVKMPFAGSIGHDWVSGYVGAVPGPVQKLPFPGAADTFAGQGFVAGTEDHEARVAAFADDDAEEVTTCF